MMYIKLDVSLEELRSAARHVLRRDAAPGYDGAIRKGYRRSQRSLDGLLHRLQRQLRNGTYKPSRLRPAHTPTSSGKRRRVLIPRLQDAIVSRLLLEKLAPVERSLPSSCICRSGVDARDHIPKIATARVNPSSAWALKADIQDAFDSIQVPDALQALQQRDAPEQLAQSVAGMLRPARPQAPGLPQGHPLSQLLLNVYLADVDVGLRRAGQRCWRYVDDLVVLGGSRDEIEDARHLLRQLLEAKGLQLHPRKTVGVPPRRELYFLGWAIGTDGSCEPSPGAWKRLQKDLKGLPAGKRQQRQEGWCAHFRVPAPPTTTPAPSAPPPTAEPPATAEAPQC